MDKHTTFLIGLILLAVFVIADGIWVIFAPPRDDEVQALALVAIGIFMLLVGWQISRRSEN